MRPLKYGHNNFILPIAQGYADGVYHITPINPNSDDLTRGLVKILDTYKIFEVCLGLGKNLTNNNIIINGD